MMPYAPNIIISKQAAAPSKSFNCFIRPAASGMMCCRTTISHDHVPTTAYALLGRGSSVFIMLSGISCRGIKHDSTFT